MHRRHLALAVGRAAQHHGEHHAAVARVVEERLSSPCDRDRDRSATARSRRADWSAGSDRARARRARLGWRPPAPARRGRRLSQKSSTIALKAPESEMTAAPPRGGDGQRISSSPRSINSSSVSTTATPAWRHQRAHHLVVAAHRAGVGLGRQRAAAALRPGCSSTIGLPAARARRASARKRCGGGTARPTSRARGWRRRRSGIRGNPRCRCAPRCRWRSNTRSRCRAACSAARITVAMAPLCDTMPTLRRPATGTGVHGAKVSGMPST